MPLYEYVCRDCSTKSEILVRSASQKIACPACGSRKLQREFSTFAAHGQPSTPCSGGTCPGSAQPSAGCSGRSCPFA